MKRCSYNKLTQLKRGYDRPKKVKSPHSRIIPTSLLYVIIPFLVPFLYFTVPFFKPMKRKGGRGHLYFLFCSAVSYFKQKLLLAFPLISADYGECDLPSHLHRLSPWPWLIVAFRVPYFSLASVFLSLTFLFLSEKGGRPERGWFPVPAP